MGRLSRAVAGTIILVTLLAGLTFALHDAIVLTAARAVAAAAGYSLSFETFKVGTGRATFVEPRVARLGGEPVFAARRIDVGYSLRDLLPGRGRPFWISFLDVERPQLTLIHHPDGSYNVPIPRFPGASKQRSAPFDMRVRVRDGSVALIDRYAAYPQERRQRIEGIAADAVLSPKAHSFYRVTFDLTDGTKRWPVLGVATFDDARGYESQHWTAPSLPIGPLVDFALSSHAINLTAGDLRDLDLRVFSLADADGSLHGYVGGRADLENGKIYLAGLAKPVRDARGPIQVYANGITVTHLDATVAGVPLEIAGGIYDFADPKLQLAASGDGELAQLRSLASASANEPLAGRLRFRMRAEGPLRKPLIFAAFQSPSIAFRTFTVSDAFGEIGAYGSDLSILEARGLYGPASVTARGAVSFERGLPARIVATVDAPTDRIPYAAQVLPHVALRSTAIVAGSDGHFGVTAYLDGDGPGTSIGGIANVGPDGTGTIGPIAVDAPDGGSLYARVALDHGAGESVVVANARRFRFAIPAVSGSLDGQAVGIVRDSDLAYFGGEMHLRGIRAGSLAVDDLAARASGNLVALNSERISGGALEGIPVSHLSATVALRGKTVDVIGAEARVAGGTFVARGSLGDGASLLAAFDGVDARYARRFGIPLDSGRVNALARVSGPLNAPSASVDVALTGGSLARASVNGSAALALSADKLRIASSSVGVGGAYGTLDGTVSELRARAPRYDLNARIRSGDVAMISRSMRLHLPYPEGTVDADVRVTGRGSQPAVDGSVKIPEGSLNGLPFHGAAHVRANAGSVAADGGSLVVGSTALRFSASAGSQRRTLRVSGDAVNLADFNDYFDASDTLAGTGKLAIDFDNGPAGVRTNGNVALADARYRRFPLGATLARWQTIGDNLAANLAVDGPAGSLHARGTSTLPAGTRAEDLGARAIVSFTGNAHDLDLGVWLPAAGISAPVFGRIDADASGSGPVRALSLTTNASLRGGIVAGVPIRRLTIAANAERGRGRIVAADLEVANLSASASGTFGLTPDAPLDISAVAQSPDIAALGKALLSKPLPLDAGTLAASLRLTGTFGKPAFDAIADLDRVAYGQMSIPHAHAEILASRDAFELRNGLATLARGDVRFGLRLPVSPATLAFGPADAPIRGLLEARAVDLAQLEPLLPKDSRFAGNADGTIEIAGTYRTPKIGGQVALRAVTFSSPQLRTPLRNGIADLAFDGTRATLSRAHADLGTGTLDASGDARIADLHAGIADTAYAFDLRATNAMLDVPQYYVGRVDGNVDLRGAAGGPPVVSGGIAFSQARVPLSAIFNAGGRPTAKTTSPGLSFSNLRLTAGNDVRVQSANVDVGGKGSVIVNGTMAAPSLAGRFNATDGSLSFYRNFDVKNASVAFDPNDGLTPHVNAVATTHVPDPSTNVTLRVTGPADAMDLRLASDPPYDREQIVGMLVGAQTFGAVRGVLTSGAAAPGPLAGISQGYLNQVFTRNLFEPLQSSLAQAFGLRDVQLGYDLGGGFSASATRRLGKNLSAVFGSTYGYPSRESFGLAARLNDSSSLRAIFYQTYGANGLGSNVAPYLLSQPGENVSLQATEPAAGESGFTVNYVRRFK